MTSVGWERVIRDPIHGDIRIGPLQAGILDHPIVQRLRYVKQNGLLHFVFPGAVHSRFAHSVGTMHVAGRVFQSLFPLYRPGEPGNVDDEHVRYLGQVFETAGLLHDVGHCAFSHSIERVDLRPGESLLHSLGVYAAEWSTPDCDLSTWLADRSTVEELRPDERSSHEALGLLLIGRLAVTEPAADAVRTVLDVESTAFFGDVQALIVPSLEVSSRFEYAAREVVNRIPGIENVPEDERVDNVKTALSTLISGTLDVDRMDYLLRDSHYSGTIYGQYDIDVIVNALSLCVGESGGPTLGVGLHSRACQALDDFMWSRYQLFAQVLNHKTNVILNALLAEALPEAVSASSVQGIGQPRSFEDFLEFTDDLVMSSVMSASLRDSGADRRMYHRALVGRDLPLYLDRLDVTGMDAETRQQVVEEAKESNAERLDGVDGKDIKDWMAKSALIKGGGLPFVIAKDKVAGRITVLPPSADFYQLDGWIEAGKLPAEVSHVHLFVDRRLVVA